MTMLTNCHVQNKNTPFIEWHQPYFQIMLHHDTLLFKMLIFQLFTYVKIKRYTHKNLFLHGLKVRNYCDI